MKKSISHQNEWAEVIAELEGESDKLQSYDHTIIEYLGDIKTKKILDYGAGPAVMASVLQKLKADVSIFDINEEMLKISKALISEKSVYGLTDKIPNDYFDIILCNLVVCIIDESNVIELLNIVKEKVTSIGHIYIGFCNPKIFKIKESNLDFRFPNGCEYSCNHDYKKVKKEGDYEIIEKHRPIEWYEKQFENCGLKLTNTLFTPKYTFNNEDIEDFIIFELKRQ
jgi:SAM-dependent methyltransferase